LSDIPEPVELVDVFRHPRFVMSILEETLRIGAKVFWLQLGIVHEDILWDLDQALLRAQKKAA
jgi:predicted CoA-binding protein